MSKNLIAANVLLLVVAGLLGWRLHGSIKRFDVENDISKIQPVRDVKSMTVEQGLAPVKPPRQYNAGEFDVIAAQNLFSETRAREEKVDPAAAVAPETPPLDVKPVLVGITIAGSQRNALIIDPSSAAAGRKTQRRKLGDSYRGYTITDIGDNKMILQNGNRREVIPLFDGSKHPTGGGKTAILATRVVSFGAGGSSGGGVGVVAAGTPPGQAASARRSARAGPVRRHHCGGAVASRHAAGRTEQRNPRIATADNPAGSRCFRYFSRVERTDRRSGAARDSDPLRRHRPPGEGQQPLTN